MKFIGQLVVYIFIGIILMGLIIPWLDHLPDLPNIIYKYWDWVDSLFDKHN